MKLDSSLEKIKRLNAKNSNVLAISILSILYNTISKSKEKNPNILLKKADAFIETALLNIKTEPILSNAISHITKNLNRTSTVTFKHDILQRISSSINHLNGSNKNIAETGFTKIKKGTVVYTFDYSSSVFHLLLRAKKENIPFKVHMTEAWPSFGSRYMATQLAKNKIPVAYYADSAMRQALKHADIVMLGSAAMAENGQVYGIIGSELVAEVAHRHGIPVYVCMDCWKYNPSAAKQLEEKTTLRSEKELWAKPPFGVNVVNYGFEKIHPNLITGIITEIGIYKPINLISEIRKQYSWIR